LICFFMVVIVKNRFGYDDSLDAFGVHGIGGLLGAILTGVFATNAVNNALKDSAGNPAALGLVDGNGQQIINQIIASGIAIALAVVGTFIILKICDVTLGVRADSKEETMGLDVSMHGEEGYNFEA
ncbi:MAG TPA: ammonia channel protein, partial [Bryobacteraceae bacterium]|nr:ammonia channel protein [Bryobacteraceae bacterium]